MSLLRRLRARKPLPRRTRLLAALAMLVGSSFSAFALFGGTELWSVVSYCSAQHQAIGLKFPCLSVEPAREGRGGYALLETPHLKSEVLLVPTTRITGIEDPRARSPLGARYWAEAWERRDAVAQRLGRSLAWNEVGLAVNSQATRSQNQLHIHIDCVNPGLAAELSRRRLGPRWTELKQRYAPSLWVRQVPATELGTLNPVADVAAGIAGAGARLGTMGIALLGARLPDGSDGYDLVAVRSDADSQFGAESLLDHACRTP
jgi:CDP-diacylglycerol pyrophosphatase